MLSTRRLRCSAQALLQRAFLLLFPGLLAVAAPSDAQTQNSDIPACTSPANEQMGESLLAAVPAERCAVPGAERPATPPAAASVTIAPSSQPQTVLVNHRLFGVLANYTTVETQDHYGKLSAATKFKLTAKTMTDPITVSFIGAVALLGQARNSDPTYGQGFSGYDKRFATFYADTGIGTLMTSSVFPTVLHQDPRYFQLGQGGVRRRLLHAVGSIVVARSDSGAVQFNYSQIFGNAVAAGISNTYHPEAQRTVGNTLSVWGSDTLLNMLCNVAKEFWPDLRHKLRQQKSN
jgi:hypothetical protein